MLSDFIDDFKNCPYYHRLFDGHDVIMIYIAGSRLYGARDERSDYDLIAIVDENIDNEHPLEFLTYKGVKVHWYYRGLESFIESNSTNPMCLYGGLLWGYINDDCIIYKNEQKMDIIDTLISKKHEIALRGARLFYDTKKALIDQILEEGRISEANYTKFLGHLCVTSFYVLNQPIDEELVLAIKRIRWQPVSKEYKARSIERLRMLKEYMENKQ